jgi:membrane-bound lytic murein transglycosylase A
MHNYKKIIFALVTILLVALIVSYNYIQHKPPVSLIKSSFSNLPHWQRDDHIAAFAAFKQSCTEITKRNPNLAFGSLKQSGKVEAWQTICNAATKITQPNNKIAREFFETWFDPYFVKSTLNNDHLFTGYYIPLLHASRQNDAQYSTPIYGLPNDLIKVNLSAFPGTNSSKIIVGQLKQNRLLPYPDRAAINHGAISKSAPILAWGNNSIDLFFAQIQGSAFIELPNKQIQLLSYAGTNGRPYTAIGKVLLEKNILTKAEISMQSIRSWLEQHPEQAESILNRNASYIFFKLSTTNDPIGNEGIPLTPQRSLAVDNSYIPLGTPIWLDTVIPNKKAANTFDPFQHLVIAQDTGGAIKGAVRGDVYWGTGDDAAFLAGHMQSPGQYWIFLPR